MKKIFIIFMILAIQSCSKSGGDEPDIVQDPDPVPDVENTAPTIPSKVFPTDGLLCTENPLEIRWDSSTDKEGDAISYEVELSQDNTFNNIIEKKTVSGTSTTLALEKGIQVHWRIRSKDSKGEYSNYSSTWNFYSEGEGMVNYLPFSPTLIYPTAFSKIEGSNVVLEWESSDVDGDPLSYDIYFGETTPPALLKENSLGSTWEVFINPNKTYYWKITVKDDNGGESIGDIWVFKS